MADKPNHSQGGGTSQTASPGKSKIGYLDGYALEQHFKKQVEILLNENERLRATIANFEQQNGKSSLTGDLEGKLKQLVTEYDKVNQLLAASQQENSQLKSLVASQGTNLDRSGFLQSENIRLAALLAEKDRQIESWKSKLVESDLAKFQLKELQGKYAQLFQEAEALRAGGGGRLSEKDNTDRSRLLIQQKDAEIDKLHQLNSMRSNEIEAQKAKIIELQSVVPQFAGLQNKLQGLVEENERLQDILRERDLEITDLSDKLAQNNFRDSYRGHLESQIEGLKADNNRLQALLASKSGPNTGQRYLEEKAIELESKLSVLADENQRLNNIILDRSRELDDLRSSRAQVPDLENKIQLLVNENDRLNELSRAKDRDIGGLRNRLAQLEGVTGKISEYENRLKSLNQALNDKQRQNDALKDQLNGLQRDHARAKEFQDKHNTLINEIDRLNRELKAKNDAVDDLRGKLNQYEGLPSQIRDLQQKLARLLDENENLQGAIADRDREIDNVKRKAAAVPELENRLVFLEDENAALKKELPALKSRLIQLEGLDPRLRDAEDRLNRAQDEINRLNKIIDDKNRELDQARARITENAQWVHKAQAYMKENERLLGLLNERDQLVSDLRSQLFGFEASKDTIKQLEQQLQSKKDENERLNKELAQARNKILALSVLEAEIRAKVQKEKLQEIEAAVNEANKKAAIERRAFESTVNLLNEKLEDYENKIHKLLAENERLGNIIKERTTDLENQKARYETLEKNKTEELEQLKDYYEEKIPREIESTVASYRAQWEDETARIQRKLAELERMVKELEAENAELRQALKAKQEEAEEWKKKHLNLEIQRVKEIEELRKQFEAFKRSNIEAHEAQIKLDAERVAYETQLSQLRQSNEDDQKQIAHLVAENDKLSNTNIDRLKEIDGLRTQRVQLEERLRNETNDLRAQLDAVKANNYDAKSLEIKFASERNSLQTQIKQLKSMIENYKQDSERLYQLMNERKQDYEKLQKEYKDLKRSYDEKLAPAEDPKASGLSTEKVELLKNQISELEHAKEEYRKQAERNSLELTKKNKELVNKIQELDLLKAKYQEASDNYENLNSQLFQKLLEGDNKAQAFKQAFGSGGKNLYQSP